MEASYHCPACGVWGYGSECWSCCDSAELVTSGPKVDNVVIGWPVQDSVHTMTHEGQR